MQSRIRDVRRAKGLTLADVAERCNPPTTAQTIGRLETGMRVLSLIWINRIAEALGVDSSDLVALPDQQFLSVAAVLHEDGTYAPTQEERIMVPNVGGSMVGLRIAAHRCPCRPIHSQLWPRPAQRRLHRGDTLLWGRRIQFKFGMLN